MRYTLTQPHDTKEEEAGRWWNTYSTISTGARASKQSFPPARTRREKEKQEEEEKRNHTTRNSQPRTSAVSKIPVPEADHSPEHNLSNLRNLTIQCLQFAPRCASNTGNMMQPHKTVVFFFRDRVFRNSRQAQLQLERGGRWSNAGGGGGPFLTCEPNIK